jgi:sugar O-acyltransferase (sialic acid O-acetyltransferase NeuD family)
VNGDSYPGGIVVWGASGHALVVADAIRLSGHRVVGFLDDVNPVRRGDAFGGARVLGGREALAALRADGVESLVVAIGDCAARRACAASAVFHGFRLARVVHPAATVAPSVTLGAGSFVAAAAVIGPEAHIGQNVIVNTSSVVDHECRIGDDVHVGPGVRLAGRVRVGPGSWLGIGSIVIDGVSIGDGCLLGAGAVLLRDLPPAVVAYGVPAEIARSR